MNDEEKPPKMFSTEKLRSGAIHRKLGLPQRYPLPVEALVGKAERPINSWQPRVNHDWKQRKEAEKASAKLRKRKG
jgi:hypothetical protein